MLSRDTLLSLESVAYQSDTKLFDSIVEAIVYIRKNQSKKLFGDPKQAAKDVKHSKIKEMIFKITGLNIKLNVTPWKWGAYNAFVLPPMLDKNHPLFDDMDRHMGVSNRDAIKHLKDSKGAVHGTIDLKKGKVSGVYSKIKSNITITNKALYSDLLSPEQVTAIIMHELGHLMAYYEYLGKTVVLNHVLGDLAAVFTGTSTLQRKVEIVEVAKDILDIDAINVNEVVKSSNAEVIQTLVLFEYIQKWNSATKTHIYDQRTFEALADEFVGRFGASRYLAEGLDKVNRLYGSTTYQSNAVFLALETLSILTTSLPSHLLTLLAVLMTEPRDTYDPPEARLKRIRLSLVNATKDPKIDQDYRIRLQKDIDILNGLLNDMRDKDAPVLVLWKVIKRSVRKQYDRAELMQELEELSSNKLFEIANRLKTA